MPASVAVIWIMWSGLHGRKSMPFVLERREVSALTGSRSSATLVSVASKS